MTDRPFDFTVTLRSNGYVLVEAQLSDNVSAESLIEAIKVAAAFLPLRPTPEYSEFGAFMATGQRIQAIKAARTAYNIGLKEAKDLVEEILSGHRKMPTATEFARAVMPALKFVAA